MRPRRPSRADPADRYSQSGRAVQCCMGRLPGFDCPAPGHRPKAAFGVAARSAAPSLGPAPVRTDLAPAERRSRLVAASPRGWPGTARNRWDCGQRQGPARGAGAPAHVYALAWPLLIVKLIVVSSLSIGSSFTTVRPLQCRHQSLGTLVPPDCWVSTSSSTSCAVQDTVMLRSAFKSISKPICPRGVSPPPKSRCA